eukprot:366441-Chlamydomonas_euryale.AAC.32
MHAAPHGRLPRLDQYVDGNILLARKPQQQLSWAPGRAREPRHGHTSVGAQDNSDYVADATQRFRQTGHVGVLQADVHACTCVRETLGDHTAALQGAILVAPAARCVGNSREVEEEDMGT